MQYLRTLMRLVSANWSFAAPLAPRVARIRAPRHVRQGSWPDQTRRRPSSMYAVYLEKLEGAGKACRILNQSCPLSGCISSGQCTCACIGWDYSNCMLFSDRFNWWNFKRRLARLSSLEYFQELEHATRPINCPGEPLVLQTDFLHQVERSDICIEYVRSHVQLRLLFSYLIELPSAPGWLGKSETTKKRTWSARAQLSRRTSTAIIRTGSWI